MVGSYTELFKIANEDKDKNCKDLKLCALIDFLYGSEELRNSSQIREILFDGAEGGKLEDDLRSGIKEECLPQEKCVPYHLYLKVTTVFRSYNERYRYVPMYYDKADYDKAANKAETLRQKVILLGKISKLIIYGGDMQRQLNWLRENCQQLTEKASNGINKKRLIESGVDKWYKDNLYRKDGKDVLGNFTDPLEYWLEFGKLGKMREEHKSQMDWFNKPSKLELQPGAIMYDLASVFSKKPKTSLAYNGTKVEVVLGMNVQDVYKEFKEFYTKS